MILRPYQARALTQLNDWFTKNPTGNPIVAACVGAGKSVMIAEFCRRALTDYPGTRILQIVPSKELIEQNLAKLFAVWPDAPAGAHSAAIGRKDLGQDILYATIGSVHKKAHLLGRIDLILVDECHLVPTKEVGMYRTLIDELTRYSPAVRVIGWTGTPMRGNGVWLMEGDEPLFTHIAARVTMRELLDQQFLAPLTIGAVDSSLQVSGSGVALSGGDYVVSQLAAKLDVAELVDRACDELVKLGADRKKWLVYGVTVEHATHIHQALTKRGISAALVTGQTSKVEREYTIAAFRSGQYRALVNVAVLTTGFDVPAVDLIALMRNTKSPVLYTQIAGRGMRTVAGKSDCLWCDFTDTTALLGPVDTITGRSHRASSGGEAPYKNCPDCGHRNTPLALNCTNCGHEFPPPAPEPHKAQASSAAVLSTPPPPPEWIDVTEIEYRRHDRSGKTASVRADYYSGLTLAASEWLCFEHSGYPQQKAHQWWAAATSGMLTAPQTVSEALALIDESMTHPHRIKVATVGKFKQVINHEFDSTRNPEIRVNSDARSATTHSPEVPDVYAF
jgi:DNA repair protein RadD